MESKPSAKTWEMIGTGIVDEFSTRIGSGGVQKEAEKAM